MARAIFVAPFVEGPQRDGRWAKPREFAYRVTNYPATVHAASFGLKLEAVDPDDLEVGDVILVEEGQTIYADGTVEDGTALVNEAAITGESPPAVRRAGGVADVLRGSQVVSGRIFVCITSAKGVSPTGGRFRQFAPTRL